MGQWNGRALTGAGWELGAKPWGTGGREGKEGWELNWERVGGRGGTGRARKWDRERNVPLHAGVTNEIPLGIYSNHHSILQEGIKPALQLSMGTLPSRQGLLLPSCPSLVLRVSSLCSGSQGAPPWGLLRGPLYPCPCAFRGPLYPRPCAFRGPPLPSGGPPACSPLPQPPSRSAGSALSPRRSLWREEHRDGGTPWERRVSSLIVKDC